MLAKTKDLDIALGRFSCDVAGDTQYSPTVQFVNYSQLEVFERTVMTNP